jgi:hypothetical protein
MWGNEEGDRVDVYRNNEGVLRSVLVRLDMRRPRRQFVEAVVGIAAASSCVGVDESGSRVEPTMEAFVAAMGASRAARFVEDPEAFLKNLSTAGGGEDEEE